LVANPLAKRIDGPAACVRRVEPAADGVESPVRIAAKTVKEPIAAIEIDDAFMPYSITVAPNSSFTKRKILFVVVNSNDRHSKRLRARGARARPSRSPCDPRGRASWPGDRSDSDSLWRRAAPLSASGSSLAKRKKIGVVAAPCVYTVAPLASAQHRLYEALSRLREESAKQGLPNTPERGEKKRRQFRRRFCSTGGDERAAVGN
jgi:hypothetical protein